MSVIQFNPRKAFRNTGVEKEFRKLAVEKLAKKGPKILLVNSNEMVSITIARTLHVALTKKGHAQSFEYTDCGVEAIERCKEGGVDVVITGLLPNGISGIRLIKQLKEESPDTKILVLTGFSRGDWRVRDAIEAGAISVFNKLYLSEEVPKIATKIREVTAPKIE